MAHRNGRVRPTVGIRVALVLALVAAMTASCEANIDGTAVREGGPAATTDAATAPTAITWGECAADGYGGEPYPDGAECGTLEVPVDYAKPDGAKAQLALIRFKATGDKIGSLVVNPGGPGGSGVQFAADDEDYLTPEILERFDRIGFDPRGVGAGLRRSVRFRCRLRPRSPRRRGNSHCGRRRAGEHGEPRVHPTLHRQDR